MKLKMVITIWDAVNKVITIKSIADYIMSLFNKVMEVYSYWDP